MEEIRSKLRLLLKLSAFEMIPILQIRSASAPRPTKPTTVGAISYRLAEISISRNCAPGSYQLAVFLTEYVEA